MTLNDLHVEGFCTWLCQREHEVVGRPGLYYHSPLALWLSEVTGAVYGVDGLRYGRASWREQHWYQLPRWAERFSALAERWCFRPMTGAEAVDVLASVERSLAA